MGVRTVKKFIWKTYLNYMNMNLPTVVNKYKESFDVYIGRGSTWGNPFPISDSLSRLDAIDLYKKHLWNKIQSGEITTDELLQLRGMRLGCFCKPQPCHGDVIVDAVEWAINSSRNPE